MFWSCKLYAILPIILIVVIWSCVNSLTTIAFYDNSSPDRLALLAFKEKVNDDPLKALKSWNDSIHHCDWNGVTCSQRDHERVTVLNLHSQKLEGTLSPHIGNLSFLREIRLGTNYFHGPIPQEIDRLSRLEVLSLANNSFDGEIPTNLTQCSKLQEIYLTSNLLSGRIPLELTSLSKLISLYLDNNRLVGSIPSMFANLTALTHLVIEFNGFNGTIPDDLCHIQSLKRFSVGENKLAGKVPTCLFNLSHITYFSIANNQLDGSLPSDIGLTLPNLQHLLVEGSKLKGLIPSSFPNASRLECLLLSKNQFKGHVPRNLGMLKGLRKLYLYSNQLEDDLHFITSLTNCTNLDLLDVSYNSLKGPMPNSIGNLSTNLTFLYLGSNQIYGSIPASIGNLVHLNLLSFPFNYLTGVISKVIGVFPKMHALYLQGNEFSGQIPNSFNHNSTLLTTLFLSRNKLHGKIPPSLGNCQSLLALFLSDNRLSGTIPKQVFGLQSLKRVLDVSDNLLSGPLPYEVGNLSNLVELYLSSNSFSGHLPSTLGNCFTLEHLAIDRNMFTGRIPQSLSNFKGIKELNLSYNKLSGEIPPYMGNFISLTQLDLSFNGLEGPVPKVGVFANATEVLVVGNSNLCGGVVQLKLPPCPRDKKAKKSQFLKLIMPAIVVSICFILILFLIFMCYKQRMSKADASTSAVFIPQFQRISYAELLRATNRFSTQNLVGVGNFSSVYKGVLAHFNTNVAVKVINLQQGGAFKSFLSECNALKNLRHRNLVKIITACSGVDFQGNDFKALVFEFMPNGCLEEWLHPKRNEQHKLKNLNFLQRLNIAIDVASALDYLHNHCQPAIIHCDLKPSNILLNDDMIAHVADFGLAKIFSTTSYNTSESQGSFLALRGTIGYVAPEYGMGGEASMQGDVYSYGIVLLEMFTGKKPTNGMFQDGQSLHNLANTAMPEQVMSIVDPTMLLESADEIFDFTNQSNQGTTVQECFVSMIRLGVACSVETPAQRMDIGEVITELYSVKGHYEGAIRGLQ